MKRKIWLDPFGWRLATLARRLSRARLIILGRLRRPPRVIPLAQALQRLLDLGQLDTLLARGLGQSSRVLQRLLDYLFEDPGERCLCPC